MGLYYTKSQWCKTMAIFEWCISVPPVKFPNRFRNFPSKRLARYGTNKYRVSDKWIPLALEPNCISWKFFRTSWDPVVLPPVNSKGPGFFEKSHPCKNSDIGKNVTLSPQKSQVWILERPSGPKIQSVHRNSNQRRSCTIANKTWCQDDNIQNHEVMQNHSCSL